MWFGRGGRRFGGALVAAAIVIVGSVGLGPRSGLGQAAAAVTPGTSTIAVVGDFGTGDANETSVANLVKSWSPDAVLATGDDFYTATSTSGTSGLGKYDLTIGRDYCPFLGGAYVGTLCSGGTGATNRFFSSTGNHDYSDGGIDNYLGYLAFPSNERYFRTTIGSVDVFILDTQGALNSATDLAAQKAWLETEARASTAPWQVAVFHHPPYSSGSHGSTAQFQWPFASWGIDLVLNGHDHTYERIVRDGITYVVDGLGGAGRYAFGTPVSGSVLRYNSNWGALRLIAGSTTLSGAFYSVDGVSRDSFSVTAVTPAQTMTFRDGSAPTAGYAGARDVTISQSAPITHRGAEATLYLDGDDPVGSASDHTTLLAFDVSALPANATVTGATLRFNVLNTGGPYGIYEALRGWDEATATWADASEGVGWGTAGAVGAADRGATSLGSVTASALGSLDVPLNASGLAVVQGWVSGSKANRGLVLANTSTTDGLDVDSAESATVANRPALLVAYTVPAAIPPTSLQWSGATWSIKQASTAMGPGPNIFSGWNAFTDGSGYLHLRIDQSGGTWRSAEIIGPATLGYGRYTFTLGSDVSALSTNVVLGLFTWSDTSGYNNREIDYEFSRWTWAGDPENAQMVVQPWNNSGNLRRFTQPSGTVSTHTIDWTAGAITWESRDGGGGTIDRTTYTGPDIPPTGDERVHLNFWLYGGNPPGDGQPVEVIIRSFSFTPAATPPPPPPAAPSAFGKSSPKNAAKVTASSAIPLVWKASAGATSYQYCLATSQAAISSCAWSTTDGTSATVSVTTRSVTRWWQVRAVNAGGTTVADAGTVWKFSTK